MFDPLTALHQSPEPAGAPDSDAAQDSNAISYLKRALAALRQAEQADTDANEEAQIAGVAAKLKQIIAGRQKEKESAMGTTPALKFVARQSQKSQAGNGQQGY